MNQTVVLGRRHKQGTCCRKASGRPDASRTTGGLLCIRRGSLFPYAAPRKYQTLGHNLPRGSGVGINYVAPWWGGRDRVALMPHALMISQAHAIQTGTL